MMPANVQPTHTRTLESAALTTKDLSIESAKMILRAAGVPCASVGTNPMYGGRVLLSEVREGVPHAGGRPLALYQALLVWSAVITGGQRSPISGEVSGAR